MNGQRFLYVMHAGGKYTITASWLSSESAFEELCQALEARVSEARTTGHGLD
jgi:hypothetical protein